jgi:hypothetical protein
MAHLLTRHGGALSVIESTSIIEAIPIDIVTHILPLLYATDKARLIVVLDREITAFPNVGGTPVYPQGSAISGRHVL